MSKFVSRNSNEPVWTQVLLVVGLVAIACLIAANATGGEEGPVTMYDVRVKPGAVTYGTHTSETVPVVTARIRQSTPMMSGNDVRSYAYYSHSSMSSMSSRSMVSSAAASGSSYRLHTTSGAKVQTSGTGASGGSVFGGSSSSSSSYASSYATTSYGGGYSAVSMPSMAMTQTAGATSSATAASDLAMASHRMGMRKAKPAYGGTAGQSVTDDEGVTWTWSDAAEDWVSNIPVGTVKEEGGIVYEWNGSTWVVKGEVPDLGQPVGDAPWLLLLLLLAVYGIRRSRRVSVFSEHASVG